ncbi:MAG: MoxR family ATPase [Candidatus Sumerlaeota bacterium]|nr:MoxR family ATPase [Candidatus Sumerlaeota bacterium]
MSNSSTEEIRKQLDDLRRNLEKVIQGKPESIDLLLTAFFADGSVLMEDVPGVGKTTLAKALAKSVALPFNRVQFTPDLLPADILGGSIYSPVTGSFDFRKGPIFCNILLADEINRASPRTQSALLEAMSEHQATIEGLRHVLLSPFLVIATQNPVEFHGTYPLPEAQLDRFLLQMNLGYPEPETEVGILYAQAEKHPLEEIEAVMTAETARDIQEQVRRVKVEESIARYIVALMEKTRHEPGLKLGASPRGSLMLFRASQSAAFLQGRDYVLPDDAKRLAPWVLSHRLTLTSKSKYGGATKMDIVRDILKQVRVPV